MELKTITISEKGQITLPVNARREIFGNNLKVIAIIDEAKKEVKIKPLTETDECWMMSQEAFAEGWFTPEEDEAWKDL